MYVKMQISQQLYNALYASAFRYIRGEFPEQFPVYAGENNHFGAYFTSGPGVDNNGLWAEYSCTNFVEIVACTGNSWTLTWFDHEEPTLEYRGSRAGFHSFNPWRYSGYNLEWLQNGLRVSPWREIEEDHPDTFRFPITVVEYETSTPPEWGIEWFQDVVYDVVAFPTPEKMFRWKGAYPSIRKYPDGKMVVW